MSPRAIQIDNLARAVVEAEAERDEAIREIQFQHNIAAAKGGGKCHCKWCKRGKV